MFSIHVFQIVRNVSLFVAAFTLAFLLAPVLIHYLYKYKAWKKHYGKLAFGSATEATPIFDRLHAAKDLNTPRMGGILIWATVLLLTIALWIANFFFPDSFFSSVSFLSRRETYLPLFTLAAASMLGLIDDVLLIRNRGGYGGGLRFRVRLALITLIALCGAWWFYFKLGINTLYVPFYGTISIDALYIVVFVLVVLATFSSSIVDGLDGLSAGVLIPIFGAYGVIAYATQRYDLVSFIVVLLGALVTYLWFNIYPAKFYMGETGIMGLTVTLAVIAFLTNSVLFLPIIALVLVLESASDIIQITSKKLFHRKIFLSAPIHHHFEALGWPESQVTMRFWIVSWVASALGVMLFFLSRFMGW